MTRGKKLLGAVERRSGLPLSRRAGVRARGALPRAVGHGRSPTSPTSIAHRSRRARWREAEFRDAQVPLAPRHERRAICSAAPMRRPIWRASCPTSSHPYRIKLDDYRRAFAEHRGSSNERTHAIVSVGSPWLSIGCATTRPDGADDSGQPPASPRWSRTSRTRRREATFAQAERAEADGDLLRAEQYYLRAEELGTPPSARCRACSRCWCRRERLRRRARALPAASRGASPTIVRIRYLDGRSS